MAAVAPIEQVRAEQDLLRFVTIGSVDDGKSTLIGRLLHDAHGVYDDQLRAVKRASKGTGAGEIDFSLFTDGLKAEREQGITIDVAYRYFATEARKFILADTPGHVQYTRNMATGASTASLAIILIDARLGVLPQSRRHATIASLLGITRLVVCVNKMDLVGFAEATYDALTRELGAFAGKLDFDEVTFIPISALEGDNVVHGSERTPWYRGPTLLEHLERVPVGDDRDLLELRFPVQSVLRPNLDYRGYAGQIASGVVRTGDRVTVLPSRKTTRVASIDTYEGPIQEAFAPMSVAIRLADEIDVSRGDMLVHEGRAPRVEDRFDARIVWLNERPLDRGKSYLLKHTSRIVRAEIESVAHVLDVESLEPSARTDVSLNDVARVTVRAHKPLFVDAYRANRATGAFILIDSLTNDTVAAGMIDEPSARQRSTPPVDLAIDENRSQVSARERRERLGHAAFAIVAQDLPAAVAIERDLFDHGAVATVVRGESAVDAAAACVNGGIIAVCVLDEAGASQLAARVARVVRAESGAEAIRALERNEASSP